MQQLLKIEAGDLLASGIFPAQPGESPLVWADARNVEFSGGLVRKARGLVGLSNLTSRPRGMKAALAETEPRLYVGAGTEFYRYRSSDGFTNIGSVSSAGGTWVFIPWGTWVLANNGVDTPELWQNSGTSSPITAPFTRANTLFKYRNQIFALGTSNGGNYCESCDFDDPTDWTATLTNTVFTDNFRDMDSDFVSAHPIGDSVALYARSDMGLFTYTGGTTVFGFRRQLGLGAVTHYSIVPVGNMHYGLTRDQVYVTDGVSFKSLENPAKRQITDWLQNNVNWDRMSEIYGWHDRLNYQIRWVIPIGSSSFLTIAYRYESGTWTIYNDSSVCGEESGIWSDTFVAKTDRLLRTDRIDVNNDSQAVDCYVISKPVDFGSRNTFKRISRVNLDLVWTGDVSISLGFTDNQFDTPTWVEYSAAREIYPDRESVYTHLKIHCDEIGSDWSLSGLEVWGEEQGYVG